MSHSGRVRKVSNPDLSNISVATSGVFSITQNDSIEEISFNSTDLINSTLVPPNKTAISLNMSNDNIFDLNVALKLIPEFSGKRSEFHKFISCCDIISKSYTKTPADIAMLLNVIKSKLSGDAYNVVKYKEFSDYPTIKKYLQDQYLERREIAQIQLELVNCRQRENEDIRHFGNRIENLLHTLNDACIESQGQVSKDVVRNLNEKTAFKAFVEGLDPDIKLIIKASRFSKLSEAIEAAVEEQRTCQFSNQLNKQQRKPQNSKFCNFCKRPGHAINECHRKNSVNQNNSQPQNSNVNNSNFTYNNTDNRNCSYCKRRGHLVKDCFLKRRNESSNTGSNTQMQGNSGASTPSGSASRLGNL